MFKRLISGQLRRPLLPHRYQSTRRTPWRQDTTPEPSVFIEENFAKHTLFVVNVGKRAVKFSLIGLLALGTTAAAVYEGVHIWVETKELAPKDVDDEVRHWEWDVEDERWTASSVRGGTDSGLGFRGRHTVRAAWMALNWGVGYSTAVIGFDTPANNGLAGPGGLKVIDARLQRAEDFLRSAIQIAESRNSSLNPQTIPELVLRHANVLERLGNDFLPQSRAQYERAWTGFSGREVEAARIAAKLGDINSLLGQTNEALDWWSKAINIARNETLESIGALPSALVTAPSSPSAQRLLSTTLVSLSAFYAKSSQLQQAQAVEEAALDMLRSIRPPESLASASPPQALHALFLLQRSSILSIHLAEVLYAQRKPTITSIQWLTSAAESSERVARALTGLPLSSTSTSAGSPTTPLPRYTSSRSMTKIANGLLRDARRTSAEAWNLLGVLYETQGKDLTTALRCYERAVDWAGTSSIDSDTKQAADNTLGSDWDVYWGNYTRLKGPVVELPP